MILYDMSKSMVEMVNIYHLNCVFLMYIFLLCLGVWLSLSIFFDILLLLTLMVLMIECVKSISLIGGASKLKNWILDFLLKHTIEKHVKGKFLIGMLIYIFLVALLSLKVVFCQCEMLKMLIMLSTMLFISIIYFPLDNTLKKVDEIASESLEEIMNNDDYDMLEIEKKLTLKQDLSAFTSTVFSMEISLIIAAFVSCFCDVKPDANSIALGTGLFMFVIIISILIPQRAFISCSMVCFKKNKEEKEKLR